jgi:hypothetical protein
VKLLLSFDWLRVFESFEGSSESLWVSLELLLLELRVFE